MAKSKVRENLAANSGVDFDISSLLTRVSNIPKGTRFFKQSAKFHQLQLASRSSNKGRRISRYLAKRVVRKSSREGLAMAIYFSYIANSS